MKIFTVNLTKSQLRAQICDLAKKLGVNKIIFNDKATKVNGTYNPKNKNMYLDLKLTKKVLLRTFFHELGHHKAVEQNKWKNYHHCLVSVMYADTVFYIENKIDQIGEKLWYKYVDLTCWGRYKYSYPKARKTYIIKNFILN